MAENSLGLSILSLFHKLSLSISFSLLCFNYNIIIIIIIMILESRMNNHKNEKKKKSITYNLRDVVLCWSFRQLTYTIAKRHREVVLWSHYSKILAIGWLTAYTTGICVDCLDNGVFHRSLKIPLSIDQCMAFLWLGSNRAAACPAACNQACDSIRWAHVPMFVTFETYPWWVQRISPVRMPNQRL